MDWFHLLYLQTHRQASANRIGVKNHHTRAVARQKPTSMSAGENEGSEVETLLLEKTQQGQGMDAPPHR